MEPRRYELNARPRLHLPVFGLAAFAAACGLAITIGGLQTGGKPGEISPPAPTIAEWAALPADAPMTYRVTEIKIGNPRTDRVLNARPAAINNRGQVVGKMERVPALVPFWWRRGFNVPFVSRLFPRPPFGETAFVWDANTGRAKTLPLPSVALSARAYDINDRGQIVGMMERSPQNPRNSLSDTHAVLWSGASSAPQDIGAALAPLESCAYGINAKGQVRVRASGTIPNPPGIGGTHFVKPIYLWEKNTFRPTGVEGLATRINDHGESVGSTFNANFSIAFPDTLFLIAPNKPANPLTELNKKLREPEAFVFYGSSGQIAGTDKDGPFVYARGTLTRPLPRAAPSTERAHVQGMNRSDDVIGYAWHSPNRPPHGAKAFTPFLWRKKRLHNINDLLGASPAWTITSVYGINDRGQIVGFAQPTDPARRIKQPSGNVYEHVVLLTPTLHTPPQRTKQAPKK